MKKSMVQKSGPPEKTRKSHPSAKGTYDEEDNRQSQARNGLSPTKAELEACGCNIPPSPPPEKAPKPRKKRPKQIPEPSESNTSTETVATVDLDTVNNEKPKVSMWEKLRTFLKGKFKKKTTRSTTSVNNLPSTSLAHKPSKAKMHTAHAPCNKAPCVAGPKVLGLGGKQQSLTEKECQISKKDTLPESVPRSARFGTISKKLCSEENDLEVGRIESSCCSASPGAKVFGLGQIHELGRNTPDRCEFSMITREKKRVEEEILNNAPISEGSPRLRTPQSGKEREDEWDKEEVREQKCTWKKRR